MGVVLFLNKPAPDSDVPFSATYHREKINFRPLFMLGLDTTEIAKLLGVTEPEVYNYIHRKNHEAVDINLA